MKNLIRRRARPKRSLLAAAATLAISLPAAGQLVPGSSPRTQDDRPPTAAAPQPNLRERYPVWVGYLFMVVLGFAVIGVSLMPSKRSHQD